MFSWLSFLTTPEEQDIPECQMPAATVFHDTHLPCDNRPQNQAQEALHIQLWQWSPDIVPITQKHFFVLQNLPEYIKKYSKKQTIKEKLP